MKKKSLFLVTTFLLTSLFSSCEFVESSSDFSSTSNNTTDTSNSENTTTDITSINTSNDTTSISFGSDTSGPTSSTEDSTSNTSFDSSSSSDSGEDEKDKDIVPKHNLTYLDLFDINNFISMTVDISDDQLLRLSDDVNENINADTYRIANSLTINITKKGETYTFVYYQVGFRMKGNTSRNPNFLNPYTRELQGLFHFKFSFQETFDDYRLYGSDTVNWTSSSAKAAREDRSFLDQEKLDARWNKEFDKTHIKEYYSLEMFRAFGIIAQHSNLTQLKMKRDSGTTINLGVYTFYEAADKALYKRSLQSGDSFINMASWSQEKQGTYGVAGSNYGDMYKCSWGANLSNFSSYGVEDANHQYVYDLKTNKDTSTHSSLQTLINTVKNNAYNDIANRVDLEYFAMYEAVSYALGNPDDCRNNMNNYMLYFRRTDGKMIMIPIDEDRTLGITRDWNPFGDGSTSLAIFDRKTAYGDQSGQLYLKTILANSNVTRSKYLENIETVFKSKWVTTEYFNSFYELAKANYGDEAIWKTTGAISYWSTGWSLNERNSGTSENYSFYEYIRLKSITAGFPVNNPAPTSENENSNDLSGKNLFIVGAFCEWQPGVEKYRFTKNNSEKIFTFTYVHESWNNDWVFDENSVELKITTETWDEHWRFDSVSLINGSGENCRISGLWRNCKIDFRITFAGAITINVHN